MRQLHWALAAGAVGIACGAAAQRVLPPAGSDRDDGSGLLAEASTQIYTSPRYGGARYGGHSYSRAPRYGGGRYANYQLQTGSDHRRGYSPSYLPGYTVDPNARTGRIAGSLSWKTPPAIEPRAGCPAPPATPAHAIVSLRGIQRGRAFPDAQLRDHSRYQLGGIVELGPCGFEPEVQVIGPIGLLGTAVQQRESAASLLGVLAGSGEVLFELDFRSRGERRRFELDRPGLIQLTAGSERGWVSVIGHPLYAAADPDGRFAIEGVPAGDHTLVVWHPPVGDGPPIEITRRVQVRAGATARVNLSLEPARRTRAAGNDGRRERRAPRRRR